VLLLSAAYAILFVAIAKVRLDRFAFRDQDLPLNLQALWAVLHGSTHISIFGVSFLGNHLQWATFPLAPLYALWQSPMFLLTLQTIALASGALPLHRIASRRLGGGLAAAVVASYLLYPALGYVNLAEFHMPSLVVPLLLWAHDAWDLDRRGRLIALVVAVALVQENFPLFGAAYGVLLAVARRDLARGIPLAVGCAAYFYVGLQHLQPMFWREVGGKSIAGPAVPTFYGDLGRSVGEMAINFARNPVAAIAAAYEPRKGAWLAHLFLPLALLPLAGWKWLPPAAPYFLQHFLSDRENETTIRSHYAAEMIPFLFIATVAGLAWVRRFLPSRRAAPILGGVVLTAAIAGNATLGPHVFLVNDLLRTHETPPDPVRTRLLAAIPRDASVVTTFDVLAHVANRPRVYALDTVARGTLSKSRYAFHLPADTEWALVDWTDEPTFRRYNRGKLDQNLARTFADGSWRVEHAEGSVTLLRRAAAPPASADTTAGFVMPRRPFAADAQLFQIAPAPPPGFRAPKLVVDQGLELLDARVIPAAPAGDAAARGGRIHVGLVWRLRVPAAGQYLARVEIIDPTGRVHAGADHPLCYNIHPPNRWPIGEIVRDDVWLTAPPSLPPGEYAVAVRMEAYLDPRPVAVSAGSADVAVAQNRAIVATWRVP
jgi:uncharacterized membrane protein